MSAAVSAILRYAGDIAFMALGVVALFDRIRRPDRTPGFFVLALGLLGLTGAIDIITNLTAAQYPVTTIVSAVLFSASGYALVEFRSLFLPLTRRGRRILIGFSILAEVLALVVGFASQSRTAIGGFLAVAALGLIGTWIVCVMDSVIRLWRASGSRPAVQRARLRTLCAGYLMIVAFLFVNVIGTGLIAGGSVPAGIGDLLEILVVLAAPVLYVSFAPPAWLRRLWRSSEEERFSSATSDLLLFSPNVKTLASKSLEWAIRLVGAAAGFIAGSGGDLLAVAGMDQARAEGIQALLPAGDGAKTLRLQPAEGGGEAIIVPLSFEAGAGHLVVIAGPSTPLFGGDELARLVTYSVAFTAALDRTRLVDEIREVNAELERRVDERTAALRASNDELEARHFELRRLDQERRELLKRVVTAQEQERRRIARDLHDDAVQVMTAVNMRVGILRDRLDSDADREVADKLEKTVSLAISRLRHILFELSPPALENHGLAVALRRRLEELSMESPFTYELTGDPTDTLDPDSRLLVYRVTQEALVNVRKHAEAKHVRIELRDENEGVLVRVVDDGRGFDPAGGTERPGHLGLVGMRERAEIGGGWWRLASAPGQGTVVEFWVPAHPPGETAATA